jgi:hypothetical protein
MAVAKYNGAIWDLSKVTSFESLVHKSVIITGSQARPLIVAPYQKHSMNAHNMIRRKRIGQGIR